MKQLKLVELTEEEHICRGLTILQAIALYAKLEFIKEHNRTPTKEEEHAMCEKLAEELTRKLMKKNQKESKPERRPRT